MTKWHLSSSNKPAVCKAERRSCPRGHYDSLPEARVAAVKASLPAGLSEADLLAQRAGVVGIDPNALRDVNGVSLTDHWTSVFTINPADRNLKTSEELIRELVPLKYGRERGIWVDWVPADLASYEYAEEDFSSMDGSPDDEAHLAAGEEPMIVIHTRNGGGNRECYCDDEDAHEPGCLSVINQRLTEHPLYVTDHDDAYDSTYANFYFRVPVDRYDDLAKAFNDDKAANRVRYADNLKQTLEAPGSDIDDLWKFFPENKELRVAYNQASTAANATYRQIADAQSAFKQGVGGVPGGYLNSVTDPQQRKITREVTEDLLAGNEVSTARRSAAGFRPRPALGSKNATVQDRLWGLDALRENQQKLREAEQGTQDRHALVEKIRALDPQLADAAEAQMTGLETRDKDLRDLRERVQRAEEPLRKIIAADEAIIRAEKTRDQSKSEQAFLQKHLRYPGSRAELDKLLTNQ